MTVAEAVAIPTAVLSPGSEADPSPSCFLFGGRCCRHATVPARGFRNPSDFLSAARPIDSKADDLTVDDPIADDSKAAAHTAAHLAGVDLRTPSLAADCPVAARLAADDLRTPSRAADRRVAARLAADDPVAVRPVAVRPAAARPAVDRPAVDDQSGPCPAGHGLAGDDPAAGCPAAGRRTCLHPARLGEAEIRRDRPSADAA